MIENSLPKPTRSELLAKALAAASDQEKAEFANFLANAPLFHMQRRVSVAEAAGLIGISPEEAEAMDRTELRDRLCDAESNEFWDRLNHLERPAAEIAQRMLCLLAVAARSKSFLSREAFRQFAEERDLMADFTPKELKFALTDPLPRHEMLSMSWRIEACATLLWALGFGPEKLGPSNRLVDSGSIWLTIVDRPQDSWAAIEIPPSSRQAIRDALVEVEQEHWQTRDAQVHNREAPDELISGVAMERHWALNWLLGQTTGDWEDTHTDT